MLFDPTHGAAERRFKVMFVGGFIVWLSVVATVVYVAAHFIAKFW